MEIKRKVLVVTWQDSRQYDGWRFPSDNEEPTFSLCTAVGFIVKDTTQEIVLCMAESDAGNFLRPLAIPRSSITGIHEIKATAELRVEIAK